MFAVATANGTVLLSFTCILPVFAWFVCFLCVFCCMFLCVLCVYGPSAWNKTNDDDDDDDNLDVDPDHHQNLITFMLDKVWPSLKVSAKSAHKFSHNYANKRQINKRRVALNVFGGGNKWTTVWRTVLWCRGVEVAAARRAAGDYNEPRCRNTCTAADSTHEGHNCSRLTRQQHAAWRRVQDAWWTQPNWIQMSHQNSRNKP